MAVRGKKTRIEGTSWMDVFAPLGIRIVKEGLTEFEEAKKRENDSWFRAGMRVLYVWTCLSPYDFFWEESRGRCRLPTQGYPLYFIHQPVRTDFWLAIYLSGPLFFGTWLLEPNLSILTPSSWSSMQ